MLDNVTLVLLAGGLGTRLRGTLHGQRSKATIKLLGNHSLANLLGDQFLRSGARVVIVTDALTAVAMRADRGRTAAGEHFVIDDFAGTGGALARGIEHATTRWVISANADTIVPCDLVAWCEQARHPDRPVTQLLVPDSVQNEGLVGLDLDSGLVGYWGEAEGRRPSGDYLALSSTGVYLIQRDWWRESLGHHHLDQGVHSLERQLLPGLVESGELHGHAWGASLPSYDFGTRDRLQRLASDQDLRQRLVAAAGLCARAVVRTSSR